MGRAHNQQPDSPLTVAWSHCSSPTSAKANAKNQCAFLKQDPSHSVALTSAHCQGHAAPCGRTAIPQSLEIKYFVLIR